MHLVNSLLHQKGISISSSALNIAVIYTLLNKVHIQQIKSSSSYGFIEKTTQTIQNDNIDKVGIVKS